MMLPADVIVQRLERNHKLRKSFPGAFNLEETPESQS